MGAINEFQRQQLDSQAVGTPGLDQSGEILAKAVGGSADAMIARQQVLDRIDYTSKFYDYQKQDELARVQLQQDYRSDPDKFAPAYEAKSAELAKQFSDSVPERARANFDLLTNRRSATIQPSNLKWQFDQQNKNALDKVDQSGSSFALEATSWIGADSYLEGMKKFSADFESTYAPVLTNPDIVQNKYEANATRMYIASMLDNNTGNAIKLRKDFEENDAFRKQVTSSLGAAGYNTAYSQAKKQVSSLMSEQTFDTVKKFAYDSEAMGKITAMFDTPAGLAVSQAQSDVITVENALDTLKKDPNAKEYDSQIKVYEEQLKQSQTMLEIATNRDNSTIKTDYGVLSDLQVKMISSSLGMTSPKELYKLQTTAAKDNKNSPTGVKPTFAENLQTALSPNPFAVPEKIAASYRLLGVDLSKDSVTANANYSEHIQNLFQVKGEILAQRNAGKINDKDANVLLQKIGAPLASLQQYDRIQGGDNSFVQAYQAFDKHAQNISLQVPKGMPVSQIRQARDAVRSQMMTKFSERMYDLQTAASSAGENNFDPGKKGTDLVIRSVIDEFNAANDPNHYPGLKKGDIVMVNGKPTAFVGYNASNGQAVHETPNGLDNSLGN